VTRLWAGRLNNWGRIPGQGERFSLLQIGAEFQARERGFLFFKLGPNSRQVREVFSLLQIGAEFQARERGFFFISKLGPNSRQGRQIFSSPNRPDLSEVCPVFSAMGAGLK
jgi:hypothetical protein